MNTFFVKCYCCFYKYIWLIPLTDKKGKTIFKVFQKILLMSEVANRTIHGLVRSKSCFGGDNECYCKIYQYIKKQDLQI